jgi:hypothetical protein
MLMVMFMISSAGCAAKQQEEVNSGTKIIAPTETAPAAKNAPSKKNQDFKIKR